MTPATPYRLWAAVSRAHLARKRLLNGRGSNEWTSSAVCVVGNAPNHSKYQTVKPHCKSLTLTLAEVLKNEVFPVWNNLWQSKEKRQNSNNPFLPAVGEFRVTGSTKGSQETHHFFIALSVLPGPDLWKDGSCKIPGAFTLLQAEIVKDEQQSICSVYKTVWALAHSISVLSGPWTIGYVGLHLHWIFLVVPPPTIN